MLIPARRIVLTVLAFNTLGDGLRDALGVDAPSAASARAAPALTERGPAGRPAAPRHARRPPARCSRSTASPSSSRPSGARTASSTTCRSPSARRDRSGSSARSGSGKTVTSLAIMRLLPSPPGRIAGGVDPLRRTDLLRVDSTTMRRLRGGRDRDGVPGPDDEPEPRVHVGNQLARPSAHQDDEQDARAHARVEMLDRVGIPDAAAAARRVPARSSRAACASG